MLFDRSLVLDPAARLRVIVQGHRAATLSVDGRNLGELAEGDHITCTAADRSARLVTFTPRALPLDPQGQVRARGSLTPGGQPSPMKPMPGGSGVSAERRLRRP